MGSEELLLLFPVLLTASQPDDRRERLHLGIRHLNVGEPVLLSPPQSN